MSFLLQLMFSSGWMFCLFVCAQSGTCWFVARYIGELEQVGVVGLTSVRLGWWFCESDVCPVCFFSKLVNLVDWLVGLSVGVEIWDTFEKDSFGILWESLVGQPHTAISHHLPIPGAFWSLQKLVSMSIHVGCVSKWRWRWIFVGPYWCPVKPLVASPFPPGAWVHRDAASGEGCESPSRTWKEVWKEQPKW